MKKLLPVFFSILTVLFFLGCNNNYPPPIPVTDIALEPELSAKPISLVIGATHELNAKVKPDNATNKTLTYTSDNTAIASVNAEGLIAAHKTGSAKITIKAGNVSKVLDVVIVAPVAVESIVFEPALPGDPLPINVGRSCSLHAKVQPENATDKNLTYSSADDSIASVDDTGEVTAHSIGDAKITIKASNGVSKEITVKVTAERIPVRDIALPSNETTISVENGATRQINAHVVPSNATDQRLSYASNKQAIASVTANGMISTHSVGDAIITITAADGISKTVNLTVTAAPIRVTSIEFASPLPVQPIELFVGDAYKLEAKAMPEGATNKKLNFVASDNSIAELIGEEKNIVKANGEGETTITITSDDNPSVTQEVRFKMKIRPIPSIRIKKQPEKCKNNACKATFVIEKVNGGLEYKPVIMGGGSKWMKIINEITSNGAEDTIQLDVSENKTIWERATSIKFKDINGKYLKDAHSQKDLEVNLTQAKNENPNVRIEWIHGITAPTSGEKKRISIAGSDATDYHKMSHIFMWEETPTTTFFNARKVTHTGAPDEGYLDGKQCWAKTNANMLHWWFTQNERYIEAYRAKNPERIAKKAKELEAVVPAFYKSTGVDKSELKLYEPFYRRELPNEEEHKKSSIANIYRRNFINHGNSIGIGLKWYLVGHSNFAKNKKYSPALFDDVFDRGNAFSEDDTALITTKGLATKKEFEEILKDALKSKKAVALNKWGTDRSQHAITLWGAAFDEDDNILAVYVVDNNDHENKIFPYGIWYQKGIDIYAEPQLDQNDKARFNPYLIDYISNVYDSKHYIGEITTLATGEAQWQAWLNKNK